MKNTHLISKQRFSILLNVLLAFFSGGVLCCFLVILSSYFISFHSLFGMTSYAPWLEEGLKFLIVLVLVSFVDLKLFSIPFLGLGFGVVERINYPDMYGMLIIVIPVIAHVLFGVVMAYFIYVAKRDKYSDLKGIWYSLALIIPVYLHLIYNITIVFLAK